MKIKQQQRILQGELKNDTQDKLNNDTKTRGHSVKIKQEQRSSQDELISNTQTRKDTQNKPGSNTEIIGDAI